MRLSTAAQMRECDRIVIEDLGLPGIALMETAGRGATKALLDAMAARNIDVPTARIGIFCGGGNNGGDGFVIARELLALGCAVDVILMAPRDRHKGDAEINLALLEAIVSDTLSPGTCTFRAWGLQPDAIPTLLAALPRFDAVVDALLGTGLGKPVRAPYTDVIDHINTQTGLVLAVDIPTGLSSDTGQPLGASVQADVTATFGLAKIGQLVHPGRALCGELVVIDIGIPQGVMDRAGVSAMAVTASNARELLPQRPQTGHKGTFGHVLAIGGATGKTGALMLCARAALKTGAGLVTAAGAPSSTAQVVLNTPEAMSMALLPDLPGGELTHEGALREAIRDGRTLAVGPGLGTDAAAATLLGTLMVFADRPMVLDADALNVLSALPREERFETLRDASSRAPIVLTPHPGEFGRLTDLPTADILRDTLGHARELAVKTGCVAVCKTASTVVAHPDGRLSINTTGNPGMATGGSGDVLTGIIAGLLAQGLDTWDAARLGVYLHGLAGDIAAKAVGARGLLATDMIDSLGEAFEA